MFYISTTRKKRNSKLLPEKVEKNESRDFFKKKKSITEKTYKNQSWFFENTNEIG